MSLDLCKAMVADNNFCVLSTCKDNLTNSSLMLYLSNEEQDKLYMVTLKGSLKYTNICENPEVSLLIDTREQILEEQGSVKALTVYGRASILEDPVFHEDILKKLTKKHPTLKALSRLEEASVLEVQVEKFLYLDGVNQATHYTLPI